MAHIHQGSVAGDARVVDQYANIAQVRRQGRDAALTGLVFTDIKLVGGDARLVRKLLGRIIVARVVGRDRITGGLQSFANAPANAPGPARYQCHSTHRPVLSHNSYQSPR